MKPIINKPLDQRMPNSKGQKILVISGAVMFVAVSVTTLLYLGFAQENSHSHGAVPLSRYLSPWQFWLFNLGLGLLGGVLINHRKALLTGVCGLFCAFLITALTMLYVSWRSSIANFEIIIPLIFAVVPTVKLYDFLNKKYYTPESKTE